jgi:DNA integrity scanning protein DisA with diadenylate cyclase activity
LLPGKEKANIQELLQEIESESGYVIKGYMNKQADPRELLLKALSKLEGSAKMIQEASRKMIEWEYQKKAMDEVADKGGTMTIEQQIDRITQKVTIAIKESDTENLSRRAGLI